MSVPPTVAAGGWPTTPEPPEQAEAPKTSRRATPRMPARRSGVRGWSTGTGCYARPRPRESADRDRRHTATGSRLEPVLMSTDPSASLGGAAELPTDHLTTSTRDPEELGRRIERWLTGVLPEGADPKVTGVVTPEGNGMSSETILF